MMDTDVEGRRSEPSAYKNPGHPGLPRRARTRRTHRAPRANDGHGIPNTLVPRLSKPRLAFNLPRRGTVREAVLDMISDSIDAWSTRQYDFYQHSQRYPLVSVCMYIHSFTFEEMMMIESSSHLDSTWSTWPSSPPRGRGRRRLVTKAVFSARAPLGEPDEGWSTRTKRHSRANACARRSIDGALGGLGKAEMTRVRDGVWDERDGCVRGRVREGGVHGGARMPGWNEKCVKKCAAELVGALEDAVSAPVVSLDGRSISVLLGL